MRIFSMTLTGALTGSALLAGLTVAGPAEAHWNRRYHDGWHGQRQHHPYWHHYRGHRPYHYGHRRYHYGHGYRVPPPVVYVPRPYYHYDYRF